MVKLEVPIRNGLTHWHIDALGGALMETTNRGSMDGAVYSVDTNGQIVIPQSDHGDSVAFIRGVYIHTALPNWEGFWAYIYDGGSQAANYYSSHTKVGNTTVITLTESLPEGTQLQVYYLHNTTQTSLRLSYVQTYPCLFRASGGSYPQEIINASPGPGKFSSAVDSDEMFTMACHEAYMMLGDSKYEELAQIIMQALRSYDLLTSDYSYYDTMDYGLLSKTIGWYYVVGDVSPSIQIVLDPRGIQNQVLKIVSLASAYAIVGKIGAYSLSGYNKYIFDFFGQASGDIYLVEICNDPNRSDTIDKRFYYAFRDISANIISYSYPIAAFRSRRNVVFSDLLNSYSGSYKGATAQQTAGVQISELTESTTAGDLIHYKCIKNSWDFTQCYTSPGEYCYPDPENPAGEICEPIPPPVWDAYAGVFITFNSSEIDSSGYSSINFYVRGTTAGTYRLIVKDANNIQFYKGIPISSEGRVTVNFSELAYYAGGIGNESLTHPIYQVYFEAKDSPITGTFYIYDVKFGQHDFLTTYNISLWQFDLPVGNRTVYIDNVGFDHIAIDDYKGCPFFSYQWSGAGIDAWFGPTYIGYVMPGIYHIMGYTDTAKVQMQFLKDAQDRYTTLYGGAYGPFMPVHTRTRIENTEYGDMNTFTWGSPNGDTNWGGYMYRAFEQVARYYYYTGDANAKTVLDRWVSWLNTNIIEDAGFPNPPKGYRPPSQYTQGTGSWDYSYYSPDFHGLIIQGLIFKYWRDGDSLANTWHRRLLDDLIYNRKAANGSYPQGAKTFGFHQGEVGKALGMLINGRRGATPVYTLTATDDDKNAFEDLYAYFYGGVGYEKPCALSPEWLPMHQRESVIYGNNEKKWVVDTAALSEGISICMYFAVDYAFYDQTPYGQKWLTKLYQFLYNAVIGDKEWTEAEVYQHMCQVIRSTYTSQANISQVTAQSIRTSSQPRGGLAQITGEAIRAAITEAAVGQAIAEAIRASYEAQGRVSHVTTEALRASSPPVAEVGQIMTEALISNVSLDVEIHQMMAEAIRAANMPDAQASQCVAEIISAAGIPDAYIHQLATEVISGSTLPDAQLYQAVCETIRNTYINEAWTSQLVSEAIRKNSEIVDVDTAHLGQQIAEVIRKILPQEELSAGCVTTEALPDFSEQTGGYTNTPAQQQVESEQPLPDYTEETGGYPSVPAVGTQEWETKTLP